jgi:hypothetical protein
MIITKKGRIVIDHNGMTDEAMIIFLMASGTAMLVPVVPAKLIIAPSYYSMPVLWKVLVDCRAVTGAGVAG